MPNYAFILTIAGVSLLAVIIIAYIFSSLYKRATKDVSFVRTGLGGEKVVMDGGAIVLPVLQSAVEVNMKTEPLSVRRAEETALTSKDKMRVDVTVEFYVRVQPNKESIAKAAQTLGNTTMSPATLKQLIEGKLVSALRSVSAEMTLNELHEKRSEFAGNVQKVVTEELNKNGLELESVSLTSLDQTARRHFRDDNAFDAEGLYQLTQITEEKRRQINEIEQTTAVSIAQKNLEAEQKQLEISRERDYARLANESEVAVRTATQQTEIETQRAEQETAAESARANSRQAMRQSNIEADQAIAISEADSKIAIAKKSEEQSVADAQANVALADAVTSEERVVTARVTEQAERQKQVAIIKSRELAESESVSIVVAAEAEKKAATDRAEALKITSEADAASQITLAGGRAEGYRVDAEGKKLLNEAANSLNGDQIRLTMQLELIRNLPLIIEQSVKPAEKIESIRILDTNGLGGGNNGGAIGGGSDGSMSDQLVNGLLKYRGQAPLVDLMLETLNLGSGGDLAGLTAKVANGSGFEAAAATSAVVPETASEVAEQAAPTGARRQPRAGTAPRPAE